MHQADIDLSPRELLVVLECGDMLHSRMQRARVEPHAVALADGTVLVGGGDGDAEVVTAELYDPATYSWSLLELPTGVDDAHIVTSGFGDDLEIELCTLGETIAEEIPPCRCGACDVEPRERFAAVGEGEACMLVIGGDLGDEAPTNEVLRSCWSDRAWTQPLE